MELHSKYLQQLTKFLLLQNHSNAALLKSIHSIVPKSFPSNPFPHSIKKKLCQKVRLKNVTENFQTYNTCNMIFGTNKTVFLIMLAINGIYISVRLQRIHLYHKLDTFIIWRKNSSKILQFKKPYQLQFPKRHFPYLTWRAPVEFVSWPESRVLLQQSYLPEWTGVIQFRLALRLR